MQGFFLVVVLSLPLEASLTVNDTAEELSLTVNDTAGEPSFLPVEKATDPITTTLPDGNTEFTTSVRKTFDIDDDNSSTTLSLGANATISLRPSVVTGIMSAVSGSTPITLINVTNDNAVINSANAINLSATNSNITDTGDLDLPIETHELNPQPSEVSNSDTTVVKNLEIGPDGRFVVVPVRQNYNLVRADFLPASSQHPGSRIPINSASSIYARMYVYIYM